MNATAINVKALMASLNDAMNAKFTPGQQVNYLFNSQELPILSLNQPSFEQAGIKEHDAEQAVLEALPTAVQALAAVPDESLPPQSRLPPAPTLVRSYSREQLATGAYPPSEFGHLLAHSYSPNGGWYVMVVFDSYQMQASSSATTHFSPWSYDRHVPLGFYGAPFAPGIYHGRVGPVDLAATWAALLGINQPSASVGHILTQALKPAAAALSEPLPSLISQGRPPNREAQYGASASPASSSATPSSPPAEPSATASSLKTSSRSTASAASSPRASPASRWPATRRPASSRPLPAC